MVALFFRHDNIKLKNNKGITCLKPSDMMWIMELHMKLTFNMTDADQYLDTKKPIQHHNFTEKIIFTISDIRKKTFVLTKTNLMLVSSALIT